MSKKYLFVNLQYINMILFWITINKYRIVLICFNYLIYYCTAIIVIWIINQVFVIVFIIIIIIYNKKIIYLSDIHMYIEICNMCKKNQYCYMVINKIQSTS